MVFVVTGTFILLFGWMGFNPGSTLGATDLRISVVAVNTNLAAVAGSAAAMLLWYFMFGKPDITMACNGMLAGLVAITAPCAFVSPTSAVIIGVLAGLWFASACCSTSAYQNRRPLRRHLGARLLRMVWRGGAWGSSPTGPMARDGMAWGRRRIWEMPGQGVTGLLHGDFTQFWLQLGGATLWRSMRSGSTYVVFTVVNAWRSMRVTREVELTGWMFRNSACWRIRRTRWKC